MFNNVSRRVVAIGLAAAGVCAGVLAITSPAGAVASRTVLPQNATLGSGQSIVSPNGEYQLTMRTDGNLVETALGQVRWQTTTAGHPGATLTYQGDSNLVVRDKTGRAIWACNHISLNSGGKLQFDAYGSLVMLETNARVTNLVTWSNRVGPIPILEPGQALKAGWLLGGHPSASTLTMQSDGNLVHRGGPYAVGASNTVGKGGTALIMQTDGNVVMRTAAGRAVWTTGTAGHPGAYVEVQTDNRVVVRSAQNQVLWSGLGV